MAPRITVMSIVRDARYQNAIAIIFHSVSEISEWHSSNNVQQNTPPFDFLLPQSHIIVVYFWNLI